MGVYRLACRVNDIVFPIHLNVQISVIRHFFHFFKLEWDQQLQLRISQTPPSIILYRDYTAVKRQNVGDDTAHIIAHSPI